ncbi:MAG: hypothetical protein ACO3ZW_03880 [Opitutales bacterium]|jgi:hypothetical protein
MTESDSQKPFNPDPEETKEPLLGAAPGDSPTPEEGDPATGNEGEKKPKLKLKQILTTPGPHLTAKRAPRDPRLEKILPAIEIPHAVPIDPDPEDELPRGQEGLPGQKGTNLPQLNPNAPAGQPGAQSTDSQGQPTIPEAHSGETEGTTAEEPGPAGDGDQAPGEDVALVSAEEPGKSRRFGLLVSVILIAALLGGIQYFLDPLGLTEEPALATPVAKPQAKVDESSEDETPAKLAPVVLSMELENLSVETFMEQLRTRRVLPSENPRGIIVDSVFIPAGGILNPTLGITLEGVESSAEGALMVISDPAGNLFQIPLKP